MSDRWNQQFHMHFRKLWIGPMHIMSRLLKICVQLPSVPVKTTALLCVLSWSEEVIDNRGGCYGDSHLSKQWGYVTKRTSDYEKFGFLQKRKRSPENTQVYLGLLSQNQKLKEKKLDLGADQDYSRYNIQIFWIQYKQVSKSVLF